MRVMSRSWPSEFALQVRTRDPNDAAGSVLASVEKLTETVRPDQLGELDRPIIRLRRACWDGAIEPGVVVDTDAATVPDRLREFACFVIRRLFAEKSARLRGGVRAQRFGIFRVDQAVRQCALRECSRGRFVKGNGAGVCACHPSRLPAAASPLESSQNAR